MKCVGLFLCLCCGISLVGHAQIPTPKDTVIIGTSDSTLVRTSDSTLVDTNRPVEKIESYAKRYDPRKALFYAAVFPGSGQVYNKKYWKVPLVYGGFGMLIYAAKFYQGLYIKYKNELFMTINDPLTPTPNGLKQPQLRSIVDEARRQRDFFLVMNGLMYILQMVDAHVDAHLKEFDLNPRLRVRLEPRMEQNVFVGRSSGAALIIKF